jgi:hypothetical protein
MSSSAIQNPRAPSILSLAAVFAAGFALALLVMSSSQQVPATAAVLPAPGGVSAGLESGGMRLRWTQAAGATGYLVYCSTHSGDETAPALVSTGAAARSALVPLLQPGLVQYCSVRAVHGLHPGSPSAEVHAPKLEAPWQEMRFD